MMRQRKQFVVFPLRIMELVTTVQRHLALLLVMVLAEQAQAQRQSLSFYMFQTVVVTVLLKNQVSLRLLAD